MNGEAARRSPAGSHRRFRWIIRGGFAIADQGLFAATNFALNIVLARWLSAEAYGTFALVYAILILLGLAYTGMFIEPMMIFASGKYKDKLSFYFGRVVIGYAIVSLALSFLFVLVGEVLRTVASTLLLEGFLGLALGSPTILLLWVLRRSCYVIQKPQWATAVGAIYALCVLGALYVLERADQITILTAFGAQAIAAGVACLLLITRLKLTWRRTYEDPLFLEVAEEHWRYGRWAMGAAVLAWAPWNLYYVVLPGLLPLSEVALLKAAMNILMPVFHVSSALSMLLLPRLSSLIARGKMQELVATYRKSLMIVVGLGIGFACLVLAFGEGLVDLLYGGKFSAISKALPIVGLIAIPAAIAAILRTVLRALQLPNRVFWCDLIGAVTILLAIPLPLVYGFAGGLSGLLFAIMVGTICMRVAFGGSWGGLTREL